MTQDGVSNVTSFASNETREELLKIISEFSSSYKNVSALDNKMLSNFVSEFNELQFTLHRFVRENKGELIKDSNSLIFFLKEIFLILEMNSDNINYIMRANSIFLYLLNMLQEFSLGSGIGGISKTVTDSTDGILENKEFQNKLELEETNLGKPSNPNIQINPSEVSEFIPQAWESDGNWYYNWEGAMLEAKTLGKRIPTIEEYHNLVRTNGNFILNMPKLGYRIWNFGSFYMQGKYGYYWSSSKNGEDAFTLDFSLSGIYPRHAHFCAGGFSVRCLKS